MCVCDHSNDSIDCSIPSFLGTHFIILVCAWGWVNKSLLFFTSKLPVQVHALKTL